MVDDGVRNYCDSLTALGIENAVVEHPVSREISGVLRHLRLSLTDCVPTLVMKADEDFIRWLSVAT